MENKAIQDTAIVSDIKTTTTALGVLVQPSAVIETPTFLSYFCKGFASSISSYSGDSHLGGGWNDEDAAEARKLFV